MSCVGKLNKAPAHCVKNGFQPVVRAKLLVNRVKMIS